MNFNKLLNWFIEIPVRSRKQEFKRAPSPLPELQKQLSDKKVLPLLGCFRLFFAVSLNFKGTAEDSPKDSRCSYTLRFWGAVFSIPFKQFYTSVSTEI